MWRAAPETFRTKGLADSWLAATRTDLERGTWVDPEAGRVPLADYASGWLADRPDLRPRTREIYRSLLRLHVLPTLGSVELADITPAKVRSWRAGLIETGHPGASTIAKSYRLLHAICATSLEDGLITRGGFDRSSQHLMMEVVRMVNRHQRQMAIREMRGKMWSPGRPSTARREDRVRFWEAIARGSSSEDAAAEAGVSSAVGTRWFREAGGMPSLVLAPLSGRYVSFAEREEIAILHAQRLGVREIGRRVGRSPSTISRELRRNASTRSNELTYRATTAQWHAERRASRPKVAKLAVNDRLREYVQDRLAGQIARSDGRPVPGPDVRFIGRRHGRRADRRWAKSWSPEQISNRLRVEFPDDESMRISPESIYQALYIQGRGALKRELVACLRTGRALRVPRARTSGSGKKFVTPQILISERPAEAEDRAVPGHWEGDLIIGLDSSAIGTLVERTTRFTMLLHLPRMDGHGIQPSVKNGPALAGHGAEAVRDAIGGVIGDQ